MRTVKPRGSETFAAFLCQTVIGLLMIAVFFIANEYATASRLKAAFSAPMQTKPSHTLVVARP